MDVALRRRLEGIAEVRISQERQTAEVIFAAGPHAFDADAFRAAVAEADVKVLRFEIDACGRLERDGDTTWFVAASHRFQVADEPLPPGRVTCLSAELDDNTAPGLLRDVRSLAPER